MEEIDTVAKAIVAAHRYQCSLSGRQVAARAGISATHYSAIRRGNRIPTPALLGKLAKVLDTPLEPLLWLWLTQHMDGDQTRMLANWLRS